LQKLLLSARDISRKMGSDFIQCDQICSFGMNHELNPNA
jgi:hypothetical protein